MGRHRNKHKNKNKNKQSQKPACGHDACGEQCKVEEQAEVVEIETQAQLQELLDIIMQSGADRTERYHRKQKELQNALLEDAGIPISPEQPIEVEATIVNDDSAI